MEGETVSVNETAKELMVVAGVGLALRVAVPVVIGTTRGPSSRGNWAGPADGRRRAAAPAVVRGDVVATFGPQRLQPDERRDGERDQRDEDGLLRDETGHEVSQGGQGSDFRFRGDQQGQQLFQLLLLASTWNSWERIVAAAFSN